jgi:probable ribonuclease FAU-1
MPTIRIRGLYAAALTQLFRQASLPWELVQPDAEVLSRLDYAWRMDSPDLDIADDPDEHGRREIIRISGPAESVEQALRLVQQHCFDVITYQDNFQVGAIYMGLVGLCSPARRRAIVYMGNQQAGVLPLRYEERDLQVGSYLPVRIAAPPAEGDDRPQLSTSLTVPGQYAVLSSIPGVKFSKQITDPEHQRRLQRLGEAQETGNWGVIWRTAAQHADEPVLVAEIQQLTQTARRLQDRLQATPAVGYIRGGDMAVRVYLPGHAKAVCDSLRAQMLPTLPGHHKYKAQGDVYGAIVDALEKELPPATLRSRTMTLRLLSSVDAMQQPIQSRLRVAVRTIQGALQEQEEGTQVGYDIDGGWVEIRQAVPHKGAYPSALRIDKQPGDYTVTRFYEGGWSYTTHFYGRNDAWKGDYAAMTTPIAIFSDHIHVVDLQVAVWRSAQHAPELSGQDVLQQLQQQGLVTTVLVQRVQEEAEAVLQQFRQAPAEA